MIRKCWAEPEAAVRCAARSNLDEAASPHCDSESAAQTGRAMGSSGMSVTNRRGLGASSGVWMRTLTLFCLLGYGMCIFYTDSKENDFPRLGRRAPPLDGERDGLLGEDQRPGPQSLETHLDIDVDEDGIVSQKEYHIAMRPRHPLDHWISRWNLKMANRNRKYIGPGVV